MMIENWVTPDRVFDNGVVASETYVGFDENGYVRDVTLVRPDAAVDQISGTLSPGFVDVQVNGGGGVLLNDHPTIQGILDIRAAHLSHGTTWILPTVITDDPSVIKAAAEAAIQTKGMDGILGLHIEGPHISPNRRGTHALEYVRPMAQETIDLVAKLRANDIAVLITLAPEVTEPRDITALSEMGAVVSLGHTSANAQQCLDAFDQGATAMTHLWNAMAPIYNRDPGPVAAALDAGVYAGIICDGYHVDDMVLRMTLRGAKSPDRLFIVSDSMPTIDGPKSFELYGARVELRDGRLINSEGTLAGAHITQAQGVARLVAHLDVTLERALRMAITTPAELMKRPELGQLLGQHHDHLILVSHDGQSAQRFTL